MRGNQIAAGIFGVLIILALVVGFADYAKNAKGVNVGLAVGGQTLSNLYAIAGGQPPNFAYSNLQALGG